MARPEIEFFFDVGSAYSYLAVTQVDALAERTGAVLRYRPFLLGGLFKAVGNTMPAAVAAKAKYMIADLDRWARTYGIEVRVPSSFPTNTLRVQRVLAGVELDDPAALPALARRFFDAYWVHDRNVGDPAVMAEIAGPERTAAAEEQRVKDRLRESTEEAERRGAFGAPTLFVGDEMFFGNDRLHHVEAFLRDGGFRRQARAT
jgi:2-hydroxychromene-2-carboxylate isomerase